ncbi:class I SAM-dependent methyltransferase [Paenibacillus sp. chi10]|uniref:Class I SAM-dependent methyltransferase n=1 Tax=Paenibacillus suaedae TaxID=3077233 RepID=A0AAJ2JY47_9BACL|nr:class I SAM-dependent methyltransferase [Paenibacillus sp. chi10]MDT8978021.1 class I SAM-dependent methyltransferase [Paenibacillus sp. chi10]
MDYSYWDNYYSKMIATKEPTPFAKDILPMLETGKTLVELGCGNGRDSLFFAENNLRVVAIDQSHNAILNLQSSCSYDNIEFRVDDFIHSDVLMENSFDYVYSRFTLHSITEEEEGLLLHNVYHSLKKDGQFFIEVRSVKDEIFGLGEKVGRNAYFYNEHYRRFIVLEEIVQKLQAIGFKVNHMVEGNNYAVYKDENPVVIRVIAQKAV